MAEEKDIKIEGSNVIFFDGKEFADAVADNIEKVWKKGGNELAMEYLKTMQGINITIDNSKASKDSYSQ